MARLDIDVNVNGASKIDSLDSKLKTLEKTSKNSSDSLSLLSGKVIAAGASIYGLTKAIDGVISAGFKFNSAMEQSIAGMTALTVATSKNISSTGRALTIQEKYTLAQKEAITTVKDLNKINAETPHTLEQTNQIYKAMYVSMKNAGASNKEMINLTKQISIAAGAAGIEFNSLLAGVDGLATGTVLANSDLGRFLSGLGLTNEALKESDNVIKLVTDKLQDFKAADTASVAVSNLANAWGQLTGEITGPTFEKYKEGLKLLTDALNSLSDDEINSLRNSVSLFGDVAINVVYGVAVGVNAMINAFEAGGASIAELAYRLENGIFLTEEESKALDDMWAETKKNIDARDELVKKLDEARQSMMKGVAVSKEAKQATDDLTASNESLVASYKQVADISQTDWDASEFEDRKKEIEDYYTSITEAQEKAFTPLESMETMLDYQIQLAESGLNWGNSLKGVAGDISNVAKATTKINIDKLKFEKADLKLQNDYAKNYLKASGDIGKQKELEKQFDEDQAKLKEAQFSAEMAGYASLAGAMASAFEQGSSGAIAFTAIQSALGIASSWSAIAQAWAAPFPSNIAAAAMVASNVMPIIGQLGGSGGGGGTAPSISGQTMQESKFNAEITDMTMQPMLDRLDRQIELLEIIGLQGTAGRARLEQASVQFEYDIKKLAEEIIQSTQTITYKTGAGAATSAGIMSVWENQMSKVNERVEGLYTLTKEYANPARMRTDPSGFLGENPNDYIYTVQFNADVFRQNSLKALGAIFEEGLLQTLSDWQEAVKAGASSNEDITAYAMAKGLERINAVQEAVQGYITSLADVRDSMIDASNTFKDLHDNLVDFNDSYEKSRLDKAFTDIKQLVGDTTQSGYLSYLRGQISSIKAIEDEFNADLISLFSSQKPEDLERQVDALAELNSLMDNVFIVGSEDALNFLESIELVGEAMATSDENTKSFLDGFKTEQELAQDLANVIGVNLATSTEELMVLFDKLSNDLEGLTDAELELLEANKALLETTGELSQDLPATTDAIKAFFDSFLTQEQLAQRMATELGVNLPASMQDLVELTKYLISTNDELTEQELELLQASKSIVDTNLNEFFADLDKQINTLESSMKKITDTIEKLRIAGTNSNYELALFNEYMKQLKDISGNTGDAFDIDAYADLVTKTTEASKALFNAENFVTKADQQFAQLVAANQFEGIENNTLEQIDYLRMIEENTRASNELLIASMGDLANSLSKEILDEYKPSESVMAIYDKYNLTQHQSDLSGYKYWDEQLSSNNLNMANLEEAIITAAVADSPRISTTVSAPTATSEQQLISSIYKDLGIDVFQSDTSGYDYWAGQLSSGALNTSNIEEAIRNAANEYLGLNMFYNGGYTGNMPTDSIAGIVHGQEYVVNAQTTRDLGLNGQGGLFKEMLDEMKVLRQENSDMKKLMVKLVSDNTRQLSTQRATLDALSA